MCRSIHDTYSCDQCRVSWPRRDRAESRLCQDLGHLRWGPLSREGGMHGTVLVAVHPHPGWRARPGARPRYGRCVICGQP